MFTFPQSGGGRRLYVGVRRLCVITGGQYIGGRRDRVRLFGLATSLQGTNCTVIRQEGIPSARAKRAKGGSGSLPALRQNAG